MNFVIDQKGPLLLARSVSFPKPSGRIPEVADAVITARSICSISLLRAANLPVLDISRERSPYKIHVYRNRQNSWSIVLHYTDDWFVSKITWIGGCSCIFPKGTALSHYKDLEPMPFISVVIFTLMGVVSYNSFEANLTQSNIVIDSGLTIFCF